MAFRHGNLPSLLLYYWISANETRCCKTISKSVDIRVYIYNTHIVFALGCPTSCKGVPYKPVCGSDKKIHRNVCKLKQNACFYGKNITVVPHQLCFNSESGVRV